MAKTISTKRALLGSALALLVCVSMLVGSTFAWFTDSVSTNGNKIVAGTLNVDLLMGTDVDTYKSIADQDGAIFGANSLIAKNDSTDTLWEPGKTQIVYLAVANNGNLDLKYNIALDVIDGGLVGALEYAIVDGAKFGDIDTQSWAEIKANAQTGDVVAGTTVAAPNGTITVAKKADYFALAVHMKESANNKYQGKDITIDITVVATQLASESDSFNNQYDKDAEYAYISTPVSVPNNATEPQALKSVSPTPIETKLPAEVLNNLPDGVEKISLAHTEANIDETAKTIKFASLEIVDQNGAKVDLSNNTEPITVSFEVPFADGEIFDIYHDDELVASVVVANGKITYEALHFCEVSVAPFDTSKGTPVTTADELFAALDKGENVYFVKDIAFKATKSNGYGKTGIVVNGQTVDGNGYTLKVTGANATWDSAIFITSGTVKNITVAGPMRGIFTSDAAKGDIYLENVTFDDVIYTFNSDGTPGNREGAVYITNCNMFGWTSFSNTHTEVVFTDCTFAEGCGYQFARPYNASTFKNCVFNEGFKFDTSKTSDITFESCCYGDTLITSENAKSLSDGTDFLFYNGLNGATIK